MSSPLLYAVPDQPGTPYPVDMARVATALGRVDGRPLSVLVQGGSARIKYNGLTMIAAFVRSGQYLSVRSTVHLPDAGAQIRLALFSSMNTWNREHHFPTLYSLPPNEGEIPVIADMATDVRHGLSDDQLEEELRTALDTITEATDYVKWVEERIDSLE